MKGPDHKASMEEKEFTHYVTQIRRTKILLGTGTKQPTQAEEEMRNLVRRSIVAKTNLKKDTILTFEMLEYKRPANGLSPKDYIKLIGRKINRDINLDECIRLEDLL